MNTRKMTRTAMIAGLYAAITFATFFMSFGAIQYRVSEMLTVLPAFTSAAIPGLSLGCALANLVGFFIGVNPVGWIDAIFGTFATFLAAVCSYFIGKSSRKWIRYVFVPLPPVLFNVLIVGAEITWMMGPFDWNIFLVNMFTVGLGQAVVCYILGIPLMLALERKDLAKRLF